MFHGNRVEDMLMVHDLIVDSELSGLELTVLPTWKKIWNSVKKETSTPSRHLWKRVNRMTVQWGAAYLCGMGKD